VHYPIGNTLRQLLFRNFLSCFQISKPHISKKNVILGKTRVLPSLSCRSIGYVLYPFIEDDVSTWKYLMTFFLWPLTLTRISWSPLLGLFLTKVMLYRSIPIMKEYIVIHSKVSNGFHQRHGYFYFSISIRNVTSYFEKKCDFRQNKSIAKFKLQINWLRVYKCITFLIDIEK
jgi:hypothetical protein